MGQSGGAPGNTPWWGSRPVLGDWEVGGYGNGVGGPECELLSCSLPGAGMAFISAGDADSMLSVPSARPGPSLTSLQSLNLQEPTFCSAPIILRS